jgi:hypothetical protein
LKQAAGIRRAFLKVDTQAGYLRLTLWAISLFILWSLFAYLNAIANPLPALPDLWPSTSQNSTSLAADVLQDILSNYFSAFSLLNLALLLLFSKAVFSAAAFLLYQALGLSDVKSAQRFLHSCLFSVQDYPLLDSSEPNFQKTDTWKILTHVGGPGYLLLEPGHVVLAQDKRGYAKLVAPQAEVDNIMFLPQGEKAIQVLTTSPQKHTFQLQGINKTGRLTGWRNLRIAYNFDLEGNDNQPLSRVSLADELRQYFSQAEPDWEEQVEEMLDCEIRAFLLNYTTTEIRKAFNMEKPASIPTNHSKPASHHSHQTTHHKRLYPIPERFFRWQKQGGFLRRRRRSLLPELRNATTLERIPQPPAADFKGELRDHLTGIFKTIYNIPINIEIENIGEIQFNGEN